MESFQFATADFGKVGEKPVADGFHRRTGITQNSLHRGDRLADQSARYDGLEAAQVWIDVKTHAVKRHPAFEPESDGRHLALLRPRAVFAFAPEALYAEIGQCAQGDFFEVPKIAVRVGVGATEVNDWIKHPLPRRVVGNVAAALGVKHLDAESFIFFRRFEQIVVTSAVAERDDRCVC